MTFEAVACSEVVRRQKAAADDYAQACKAYAGARRQNPSEPRPRQSAVVVLEKTVRGKEAADALAAKYRERYEQAQARKQKESGPGTPTSAEPAEDKAKPGDEAGAGGTAGKTPG